MYYFSFIGSVSYRITGNTITMLCRSNKGKILYIKNIKIKLTVPRTYHQICKLVVAALAI